MSTAGSEPWHGDGKRRREGRTSPGAVLTVPPRSLLPRPRRAVGFSSCARDCWNPERGISQPVWVLDHGTSLLPAVPGSSPLAKELLPWGERGKWEMSPSTAAVLAASPGPVGESAARWPSPPFAEEQTGPSAKPEEMILRPQSWGDLGVPVHKGTKPAGAVAAPAGRRFTLSCALRGCNQGVMLGSDLV